MMRHWKSAIQSIFIKKSKQNFFSKIHWAHMNSNWRWTRKGISGEDSSRLQTYRIIFAPEKLSQWVTRLLSVCLSETGACRELEQVVPAGQEESIILMPMQMIKRIVPATALHPKHGWLMSGILRKLLLLAKSRSSPWYVKLTPQLSCPGWEMEAVCENVSPLGCDMTSLVLATLNVSL